MTPTPEFRENSRERGARSPAYRSQRFDPPLPGHRLSPSKAGKCTRARGVSRGESGAWSAGGRHGAARHTRGRTARGAEGVACLERAANSAARRRAAPLGRSGATWRQRRGFCRSRGNGPGGQPGPTWGQIWAAVGLPGRFQTFRGRFTSKNAEKTGAGGRKRETARHRRGLFPARAGRGGRRFGKNTVIRRRKKLHKPRTVITDPGAGAGSRPRTRYISRPFSGRFSLSDKSYFSPE